MVQGKKFQALRYVAEGQDHFLELEVASSSILPGNESGFKEWIGRGSRHDNGHGQPSGVRGGVELAGSATMGLPGPQPGESWLKDRTRQPSLGGRAGSGQRLGAIRRRPSSSSSASRLGQSGSISARFSREKRSGRRFTYKNEGELGIRVRVIQSPTLDRSGPQLLRCRVQRSRR